MNVAHDGDTIVIGAGTFAGGITIDKSVRVLGAGASKTIINGGGPVVTVFRATAPDALSVTIDGVTITGGVNNSQPDPEVTFGGGVLIPSSQLDQPPFNGTGATVSISNSVITDNTVTSSSSIPPGFCGPRACGFNDGGGIDNGGVLTLTNTRVTNNTAGSTPSIGVGSKRPGRRRYQQPLRRHACSPQQRCQRQPRGREQHDREQRQLRWHRQCGRTRRRGQRRQRQHRRVHRLDGLRRPVRVRRRDQHRPVLRGSAHPTATIRNTQVSGNSVVAVNTNPNSLPAGFGGGIVAFAPALLENVSLTDNAVQVTGAGFAVGDGGGMEVDAPVTVRNSLVGRNSVAVAGPSGVLAFGGGIAMFGGDLTLERTVVVANSVSATGAAAPLPFGGVSSALGGGISNGGPGNPSAALTLTDSVVNANRLSGSAGVLLNGGGVFTDSGVMRTRTVIAGNKPDDCSGC